MTNHSEMQVDCFWAACPHLVHFLLSSWTNDDVVVQRFPSWSLAAGSLTLVRTQFLTRSPLARRERKCKPQPQRLMPVQCRTGAMDSLPVS